MTGTPARDGAVVEPPAVPPRRTSLAEAVQAGVALTSRSGLAAVTLRGVARELGVQAPSLYHHVPGGLDELRARIVDRVIELNEERMHLDETPQDGPWERLERPLRSLGRITAEYPGVLQYILTTGRDRPQALVSAYESIKELLASELGPVAPAAWLLIHTYVTGWAFAERPSSAAARKNGLHELGRVLGEAEELDEEKILFEGLRALLAGLLTSTQRTPVVEGAADDLRHPLERFLR